MNLSEKIIDIDESEIEYYTEGYCHVFAVALAEYLNIKRPKFLVFGDDEDFNEILHVSLLIDDISYDIRGGVHTDNALENFCDFLGVMSEDYIEEEMTKTELKKFYKNDYPLEYIGKSDIDRAKRIIEEYYLPSFSNNYQPS